MFCRNCGKELAEQAFASPSCGCLARDLPYEQPKTETEEELALKKAQKEQEMAERIKKAEKKTKLFSVLAFVFLCVSMCFVFAQISEYLLPLYGEVSYYEYDTSASALAMLFSWAALAMGIVSFVFSTPLREKNPAMRTIACFVFIAGIVGFFIPIFFLG